MTGSAVLRRAFVGQRPLEFAAAGLLMLSQTCESLVPVLIGVVIDRAVRPSDVPAITLWISVLGVHFLVLSVSGRFGGRLEQRAVQQAVLASWMRLPRKRSRVGRR